MSITRLPRRIAIACIRVYQRTLSFDHGPLRVLKPYGYCRFHPSCSEYACRAIEKYGVMHGGVLSAKRVVRCNPWSAGGEDDV